MAQSIAFGQVVSLKAFSRLLLAGVLFLIFAGALVTSNHAGLAVPDWPTTFGQNMFLYPYSEWEGGIFYEHGHRLIASIIGMLTVVLFGWTMLVESRKWLKVLTGLGVLAVVLQGLLGGLTVLYLLPPEISTAHAMLGQTFLIMTLVIAYAHSDEELLTVNGAVRKKTMNLSLIAISLIYIQLFIGAYMRHSYAGLAIPDFPTTAGNWLPVFNAESLATVNAQLKVLGQWPVSIFQMKLHFAHRLMGVLLVIYFSCFSIWLVRRNGLPEKISNMGKNIFYLVILQFCLGIAAVFTVKEPILTSCHVLLGAIFLAYNALLFVRIYSMRES